MFRKPVFDAIRRLIGGPIRQREVAAIDAALDEAERDGHFPFPDQVTSGASATGARRTVSEQGVALIQQFEGCARRRADGLFGAYPDPGTGGAPWTIGWGATGTGIGPDTVWTQDQCDARLVTDLARYAAEVDAAIGAAPTTQAQFDAMVCFHYNTGAIARATLTAKHKAGDYAGAGAEFARWNRAGGRVLRGLVRRRAAEAALYLNGKQRPSRPEPGADDLVASSNRSQQMLRSIGAAAVLALAATNPAFAQGKGHGNGGGNGQGGGEAHAGKDHGQGGGAKDNGNAKRGGPDRAQVRDLRPQRLESDRGDRGRMDRARDEGRAVVERTVVRHRDGRDWGRGDGGDWDRGKDWYRRDRAYASVPGCPPGLAKKNNGCLPPGLAKGSDNYYRNSYFGYEYQPSLFGIPIRTRANYAYYDGYLIPASGSGLGFVPLLGGALAVGQVWPQAYPSMPIEDWRRDYYGFSDPRNYRYADNVIYRVDPQTAAIESVVALLTGNDFAVGQRMPAGYDVYNVPGAYQDRYYDTNDALYRYADGRVYEIDPTSMLIAKAIDLVL
jgi:GH24 family phage-related lysozyme (muramidase)